MQNLIADGGSSCCTQKAGSTRLPVQPTQNTFRMLSPFPHGGHLLQDVVCHLYVMNPVHPRAVGDAVGPIVGEKLGCVIGGLVGETLGCVVVGAPVASPAVGDTVGPIIREALVEAALERVVGGSVGRVPLSASVLKMGALHGPQAYARHDVACGHCFPAPAPSVYLGGPFLSSEYLSQSSSVRQSFLPHRQPVPFP